MGSLAARTNICRPQCVFVLRGKSWVWWRPPVQILGARQESVRILPSDFPSWRINPKRLLPIIRKRGERALRLAGGNVPRGHQAAEAAAPAQRGETGQCPCCVGATYVATPALSNWVAYSEQKAVRIPIWQQRDPRAGRGYAAALCASTRDGLPTFCD